MTLKLGRVYEWHRPGISPQQIMPVAINGEGQVTLLALTIFHRPGEAPFLEATRMTKTDTYLAEQQLVKVARGDRLKGMQKRVARQRYYKTVEEFYGAFRR